MERPREFESIDPSSPHFPHLVPFVIVLLFAPSLVLSLGTNRGVGRRRRTFDASLFIVTGPKRQLSMVSIEGTSLLVKQCSQAANPTSKVHLSGPDRTADIGKPSSDRA